MLKKLFVTTAMVMALVVPSSSVLAVRPPAPGGNNGTLKVHEQGTPSGTESNDPKVCAFNFEGFGFDVGQTGTIEIDTQGGGPTSTTVASVSFGPADASGYYATDYFNSGGSLTVPNGMYKATLYGKDVGNPEGRTEEKAKSKVFKVECEGGRGGGEEIKLNETKLETGGRGGAEPAAPAPQAAAPAGPVDAGEGSTATSLAAAGGLVGSLSILGYGLRRMLKETEL